MFITYSSLVYHTFLSVIYQKYSVSRMFIFYNLVNYFPLGSGTTESEDKLAERKT